MIKYLKLLIGALIVALVLHFPFSYYFLRYENPDKAIRFYAPRMNEIIDYYEVNSNFTLYFYTEENQSTIRYNFLFQQKDKLRLPTMTKTKTANHDDYTATIYFEKGGQVIVVITSLVEQLELKDSLNTNYKEMIVSHEGVDTYFYFTYFDELPQNYQLTINNEMISNWSNRYYFVRY